MKAALIDEILEPGSLRALYQPIYRLGEHNSQIYAVEGLTRGPVGTNAETAEILFEYVRRKSEEVAVDRACIALLVDQFAPFAGDCALWLNVHASTLCRDAGFVEYVGACARHAGIALSEIALEVVEHSGISDRGTFRRALASARERGISIVLDDVGLGQSNYRMILDCEPDRLKLDRYLVDGCHQDDRRGAVIRSIVQMAGELGCQVVAEGVEADSELAFLRDSGIELFQGYLFCRPLPIHELLTAGPPPISLAAAE